MFKNHLTSDFHQGPVRVKRASIEKFYVPSDFSPLKPDLDIPLDIEFQLVLKNRNPRNIGLV